MLSANSTGIVKFTKSFVEKIWEINNSAPVAWILRRKDTSWSRILFGSSTWRLAHFTETVTYSSFLEGSVSNKKSHLISSLEHFANDLIEPH